MMIQMTVHDNEQTSRLVYFADVMRECDMYYSGSIEYITPEKIARDQIEYVKIWSLIANNTANAAQIDTFEHMIKSKFRYFCYKYPFVSITEDEAKKLVSEFDVKCVNSLVHLNHDKTFLYILPETKTEKFQTIIL